VPAGGSGASGAHRGTSKTIPSTIDYGRRGLALLPPVPRPPAFPSLRHERCIGRPMPPELILIAAIVAVPLGALAVMALGRRKRRGR
jgi:hypothetical protein